MKRNLTVIALLTTLIALPAAAEVVTMDNITADYINKNATSQDLDKMKKFCKQDTVDTTCVTKLKDQVKKQQEKAKSQRANGMSPMGESLWSCVTEQLDCIIWAIEKVVD